MNSPIPADIHDRIRDLCAYCVDRSVGLVIFVGVTHEDGTAGSVLANLAPDRRQIGLAMASLAIRQGQQQLAESN